MQYSTTHGEQWTCVVADRQQEMRQVAAALQRLRQMNRNEIVRHQSGWNRLNTILVPEDFMNWANSTYGEEKEKSPSRLILEVNNPADERIAQYFQQQGYTTESDKLDAGKTTWL